MGSNVLALPTVRRIGPANPAFDTSPDRLRCAWREMQDHPKPLDGPVVLLAGWRSPSPAVRTLARNLRILTSGREDDFLTVSYPLLGDLDRAVDFAARAIGERLRDPASAARTREIDVVAISMGGLVARAAAIAPEQGTRPQLVIRRLFTLATPHRGAKLADRLGVDKAARDMRAGSAFLRRLDEALANAPYELVCYARLGDAMVGATNAAPPGREPIWVPSAMMLSHLTIAGDKAIASDIARRLRGEEPLGRENGPPPRD